MHRDIKGARAASIGSRTYKHEKSEDKGRRIKVFFACKLTHSYAFTMLIKASETSKLRREKFFEAKNHNHVTKVLPEAYLGGEGFHGGQMPRAQLFTGRRNL